MFRRRRQVTAVLLGGAAVVITTVVFAIEGCATKPAAPPGRTPSSSASQPGSSGPGVAVSDPETGRTSALPPEEAAAAIRSYWTPERMKQAQPAP
jgi:hypothetical protein